MSNALHLQADDENQTNWLEKSNIFAKELYEKSNEDGSKWLADNVIPINRKTQIIKANDGNDDTTAQPEITMKAFLDNIENLDIRVVIESPTYGNKDKAEFYQANVEREEIEAEVKQMYKSKLNPILKAYSYAEGVIIVLMSFLISLSYARIINLSIWGVILSVAVCILGIRYLESRKNDIWESEI